MQKLKGVLVILQINESNRKATRPILHSQDKFRTSTAKKHFPESAPADAYSSQQASQKKHSQQQRTPNVAYVVLM